MSWFLVDFDYSSIPKKKCRYLIDNNISIDIPNFLEKRGYKTFRLVDLRLQDRDDEFLYQYAYEKGLVILTQDKGFLNHRRFRFQSNPTVIVFQKGSFDYSESMYILLKCVSPYSWAFSESKIYITSDGIVNIFCRDETGKIIKVKSRYDNKGNFCEWENR